MKKHIISPLVAASSLLLSSTLVSVANNDVNTLPVTKEQQDKMTPNSVLADLIAGNKRFQQNDLTKRDVSANLKASKNGQFPKAYILSCVDSRVPVERVFDQGTGDIFVGRVAGNIETTEQLGSMEYAAAVGKVKLILVMGHESCGAVKGACDHVKMGNLTELLTLHDKNWSFF